MYNINVDFYCNLLYKTDVLLKKLYNWLFCFWLRHYSFLFYFYPMRKYQPFIRTMRTDSRVHFCFFFFFLKKVFFYPTSLIAGK